MNSSWSNSSTGFEFYIDVGTPPSDTKKSDFIGFSECHVSPQKQKFSPTNYSSPYRRGSPRNFNKRGNWRPNFNLNKSYSPNNSYNSSYNNSWSRSRDNTYQSNKSRNESFNKSNFLHSSFTENPWAILEKKLDERERQQKTNLLQESEPSSDNSCVSTGEQIETT